MLSTLADLRRIASWIETFCIFLFLNGCGIDVVNLAELEPSQIPRLWPDSRDIPRDKNALVREIQTDLNALGYQAGPADGLMGKKTRSAIRAFQKASKLEVDGEPSTQVLLALRERRNDPLTSDDEQPDPTPECENESNKSGWFDNFKENPTSVVVDCSCEQLVEPFEITSNIEAAAKIVYEESITGAERWLNNILKGDYQPDIQLKDVKKAVKRMNWMPLEIEKKYGEILQEKRNQAGDLKFMRRNSSKRSTKSFYEKADKILAQLVSVMPADQPYTFNVLITDSLEVNAEAIPGGTVYITRGALEQDLGYFVLGHELAHVSKRHTTTAFQSRLIDTVDTVEDLKSLVSSKSTLTSILGRGLALNKILIKYNQAQELQSDACAVRMLTNLTNIESEKEIDRFIGHLAEKATTKPDKPTKNSKEMKFLGQSYRIGGASSHPAYPERIKHIESMANLMRPG